MADKPSDIDEMLGRKDPYEFWLQEANLHSGPLQSISPNEVLSIIRSAFGHEWLDEKINEPEKGSHLDSSRHPFAKWVLTPGETQVRSMFEIAIYLRQLHSAPRLNGA